MGKDKALETQLDLIMEFFRNNSNREIKHPEVVDWVVAEYKKRTGRVFRDPDRGIRSLAQQGQLIKIAKGVYKYDLDFVKKRELDDFTPAQKEAIFKRDHYRCVVCGKGWADGVEIHADHIRPRDLDGKSEIENGQTLCAQHNFQKKNYKQTETGKRMFIRLYELAKAKGDKELQKFCAEILGVYARNKINCHIIWER